MSTQNVFYDGENDLFNGAFGEVWGPITEAPEEPSVGDVFTIDNSRTSKSGSSVVRTPGGISYYRDRAKSFVESRTDNKYKYKRYYKGKTKN